MAFKHAAILQAWLADPENTVIQFKSVVTDCDQWIDYTLNQGQSPGLYPNYEYRIKPKQKVWFVAAFHNGVMSSATPVAVSADNLKLTFEDGKLVSAEVLK